MPFVTTQLLAVARGIEQDMRDLGFSSCGINAEESGVTVFSVLFGKAYGNIYISVGFDDSFTSYTIGSCVSHSLDIGKVAPAMYCTSGEDRKREIIRHIKGLKGRLNNLSLGLEDVLKKATE